MVLEKFSLEGQVGIVTGAGQGLGKVFALAFAQAGADIVIAEIDPDTGPQTVAEVQALGRRALYVETDVRRRESVEAMVTAGRLSAVASSKVKLPVMLVPLTTPSAASAALAE